MFCTCRRQDGSTEQTQEITLGETRNLVVDADVMNMDEDAFQTDIIITVPTGRVDVGRVFGSLNSVSKGLGSLWEVGRQGAEF